MQQDTFNHVKTHFSEVCHRVIEDQDVLLVTREDADNVVIMPQSLFDSWLETIYLLKSPANAAMLEKSIAEQQSEETVESIPALKIQKLNPLRYAHAPTEPFQAVTMDKTKLVFSDIEDSEAFAKKLRQQAWERHE
jgi:antitoxin YefM